jgi:hypothetical protein
VLVLEDYHGEDTACLLSFVLGRFFVGRRDWCKLCLLIESVCVMIHKVVSLLVDSCALVFNGYYNIYAED